jgi:hypothetical protein
VRNNPQAAHDALLNENTIILRKNCDHIDFPLIGFNKSCIFVREGEWFPVGKIMFFADPYGVLPLFPSLIDVVNLELSKSD